MIRFSLLGNRVSVLYTVFLVISEKLKSQCLLPLDTRNKALARPQVQSNVQTILDCEMKIAKSRRENRERKTTEAADIVVRVIDTNGKFLSFLVQFISIHLPDCKTKIS